MNNTVSSQDAVIVKDMQKIDLIAQVVPNLVQSLVCGHRSDSLAHCDISVYYFLTGQPAPQPAGIAGGTGSSLAVRLAKPPTGGPVDAVMDQCPP